MERKNDCCGLNKYRQIEKLVENLNQRDSKTAYTSFKVLKQKSQEEGVVYLFLDSFVEMMNHENSYVRTRGLLLIAANAKWDQDNKIDEIIDTYLKHIVDEKPITARQLIKALPQIAWYKKELRESIVYALRCARPEQRYAASMWPLVKKDIVEALQNIEG